MGWIRRETEKGTTQYICPNCHDYHEFREDFGEQTFNENFVFCRRCGARNGTGTSVHPHPAERAADAGGAAGDERPACLDGNDRT